MGVKPCGISSLGGSGLGTRLMGVKPCGINYLINSLGPKFSSQGHFHSLQLLNAPQFLYTTNTTHTHTHTHTYSHEHTNTHLLIWTHTYTQTHTHTHMYRTSILEYECWPWFFSDPWRGDCSEFHNQTHTHTT